MLKIVRNFSEIILKCPRWITEGKRSTFVVRRTRPIRLSKMESQIPKKLKDRNYLYELVHDTDSMKKPLLNLVLLKDVPGVGMMGEKIEINCYVGYRDLLLPKLAVYADSPEAEGLVRATGAAQYSSKYSKIVENYFASLSLPIILNSENNWTLQPWHVKFALRKKGIMASEECIVLPEKEISGPNPDIENKDFVVKLIMNKSETFSIRCRIFHSKMDLSVEDMEQMETESESLFPEEKEVVKSLFQTEKEVKKSESIRRKGRR